MAATPTNLDALQDAFVVAINAIVPRYSWASATSRWRWVEEIERKPGATARVYSIDWDSEGYTRGGFMGSAGPLGAVDTTVTLSVITDYGGVPVGRIKRVAEDDWYQIRDVLSDLKPTTNGLLKVEALDWDFTKRSTDMNQAQIALQYEVRYMKARAQ